MAIRFKLYKCENCGNIVSVLDEGHGTLKCCGAPMIELNPHEESEGHEKHVPAVTVVGDCVEVTVGSTPHPMLNEHYIEWIELSTDSDSTRHYLMPGAEPKTVFPKPQSDEYLVSAFCNVHGLWDSLNGHEHSSSVHNKFVL